MTTGVVLMAYGTPRTTADIEAYYTDIRRGRPPSAEQLAELTGRYEAIGGTSPLAEVSEAQRDQLQAALDLRAPGRAIVELGYKHAAPTVEAAVGALAAAGVERVMGLVLAPHYSARSIGEYLDRAGGAAEASGLPFAGIESWATEPAYVAFLADEVRRRLDRMPPNTKIVFTAHSLPQRILADGDPYPDEVRSTAAAVGVTLGLPPWAQWSIAWQSAGRTPEPWLVPDVLTVIDELAGAENADGVLVCPCGFVADHLEVLYDLDIEARGRAERQGLVFERTASMNADASVLAALADRVRRHDDVKVIVVGGGISGLATAHALAGLVAPDRIAVEVREADDRVGGKLKTSPFAGLPTVDEGADAFLARVPDATELARHVGLGDALVSPTAAHAAVVSRGQLHPLPDGLVLGVPASVTGLAAGGLLSWRGKVRAAVEPLIPARDPGDSIGALVRHRLGDEVHERLVDALVGTIYGADTDRFSLAMVPQLAELAGRGRSLLLSARRMRAAAPASAGPVFLAPRAGMGALTDTVADAARDRGVTILLAAPVTELARDGTCWRVDGEPADAVVLATPAAPTAPLLATVAPEAARLLATMDHAGVVLVTLAVGGWPERLRGYSGYLVPKPEQTAVTAVSFASQKWAHWRPDDDREIVRVSLGRDGLPVDDLDDAAAVAAAVGALERDLALDVRPVAARVSRWPASFPQYRPHHRQWLDRVDAALPTGLFVTGASYRGIGVPACVAQAEATARAVAALLHPRV